MFMMTTIQSTSTYLVSKATKLIRQCRAEYHKILNLISCEENAL